MGNRIYSFLGLATKAGKTVSGEERCISAIKKGKACLVIIAEDAANNTKVRFEEICRYKGVEVRIFGKKELLGKFTGKDSRAVVVILDRNFAKELVAMIDSQKAELGV